MRRLLILLLVLVLNSAPLSFGCGVDNTECSLQKRRVCPDGEWDVPIIKRLPKAFSKFDREFRMTQTTASDGKFLDILTYYPRQKQTVALPFACTESKHKPVLDWIDRFLLHGRTYAYVIVVDRELEMMCGPVRSHWALLDEDGDGKFEVAESIQYGQFPHIPAWALQSETKKPD